VVSRQLPLLDALLLALVEDEELLDALLLALDEVLVVLDELLLVDAAPPLPPLPSITMVVAQPTTHDIQAPPIRIALCMPGWSPGTRRAARRGLRGRAAPPGPA
jgi:hypothetical protein